MTTKFCFFHPYHPDTWQAMVDCGLVKEGDGVRFSQSLLLKETEKFNSLAGKGSALYQYLEKTRAPFYIDRLQGGIYIDEYPYDKGVLQAYRDMLGENFLGFQMHEWLSNYQSDLKKLKDVPDESWTAEEIDRVIREKYKVPFLFLEAMTAKEMAAHKRPQTAQEFCDNMFDIYRDRRDRYRDLVPCDSGYLAFAFELREGAELICAEVGGQSADMRMQLSYARGMARAHGKKFGAYYEPWGGDPFTTCCYHKEEKNEWGVGDKKDFPFVTGGSNGGSSRSLQHRVMLYAYLCNVDMMSEEWGLCNTFLDWKDFELSEYGRVKLDFLSFTRKYTDIGEKLTPAAVVLPEALEVLDDIRSGYTYCGFKVPVPLRCKLERIKDGIRRVFSDPIEFMGTEYKTLINSRMPDAVDMLNAGAEREAAIAAYRYLIDLTGDPAFAAAHPNCVAVHELPTLLREALPCEVEGFHWVINERDGGGYYLTVFNHIGVTRSMAAGEHLLPEATRSGKVRFKNGVVPTLLEGEGILTREGEDYRITIPAGGFAFIRF
ncbi:MAG: hypothetical protein E7624_09395 [Ruminococcaceae bacterium]|nr:hypothetical protein [Oscillospiraceae bacterium]